MSRIKKYITCQKKDRLGMQIYSRLWTAYFAKQKNLQYVHTPLESPYEDVFNLGANYPHISDVDSSELTIFSESETNYMSIINRGLYADFSSDIIQSIIKNYNPQNNILQKNDQTNICIHVRRGDTLDDQYKDCKVVTDRTCSPNDLQFILNFISKHMSKPYHINIHTDDNNLNLIDYDTHSMNIDIYNCDTPELAAINDMILCDILFPSGISSFSRVSGIYNQNIVISKYNKMYNNLFKQKNRKYFSDYKFGGRDIS